MSWSELQRLVEDAEADGSIRRGLRRCRSPRELVMACRRLGYGVQALDLRSARALEGTQPGLFPSGGRGGTGLMVLRRTAEPLIELA